MPIKKFNNLPIKPGFENLRIWQVAFKLMQTIHEICRTLPRQEYRLKDQAERSSSAVPDEISEGYGSYYFNEKNKCFYTARREATETQNHLRKMEAKRCLTGQKADEVIGEYEGLIRGINAYINYIKQKSETKKR